MSFGLGSLGYGICCLVSGLAMYALLCNTQSTDLVTVGGGGIQYLWDPPFSMAYKMASWCIITGSLPHDEVFASMCRKAV